MAEPLSSWLEPLHTNPGSHSWEGIHLSVANVGFYWSGWWEIIRWGCFAEVQHGVTVLCRMSWFQVNNGEVLTRLIKCKFFKPGLICCAWHSEETVRSDVTGKQSNSAHHWTRFIHFHVFLRSLPINDSQKLTFPLTESIECDFLDFITHPQINLSARRSPSSKIYRVEFLEVLETKLALFGSCSRATIKMNAASTVTGCLHCKFMVRAGIYEVPGVQQWKRARLLTEETDGEQGV